jgi:hypothetical protein
VTDDLTGTERTEAGRFNRVGPGRETEEESRGEDVTGTVLVNDVLHIFGRHMNDPGGR